MVPILKGLGATDEDLDYAQSISDLTGPDPTLDYHTVTHGRYSIDFASRSIQRLEQQPYTLTVQEDYRRHDSGIPRRFDETPPEMQGNTVVQALLLFKALVFQDVFLGSDNMHPDSAVTFMHDNRETTGMALSETNPALIRARVQHCSFLDTLVFVDHDFKHSVTSVYAVDERGCE